MHSVPSSSLRSRQAGSALFIAVILLLLAGLMTLFALNVGVFEQRSTTNDLRSKMVNEVAEAGLAQGFEYLMRQHRDWMGSTTRWELCQLTDNTFPCGAIATANRSTMYRYKGAAGSILNVPDTLDAYMLPLENEMATVGNGFDVKYGVAPVLCFVKKPAATDPPTTPIRCATNMGDATNQRIVTFVSVAMIPGESARTTLTQTIGQYSLVDSSLNVPPITASGSVDLVGTLQVVTNANAGGPGVPVSIWTRRNVAKTGTPNTCYADEFFRYGTKGGPDGTPVWTGATTECPTCDLLVCDACGCDSDKSLSYDSSGNQQDEGMDILDIDGNTASTPIAKQINYDVIPSEFPCDLFEYVFGADAKSWSDNGLPDPPFDDYFCETKITRTYTPSWNQAVTRTIGADEAFLYKNAAKIIPDLANPDAAAIMPGSGKQVTTAYLDANASGIIWCQVACAIGPGDTVGSPSKPVVLIMDGTQTIKGRVFGMVFVRSTGAGPLNPATGGNAELTMNGKAAVYGAVIVQGKIEHANGSAAVISSPEVLKRIGESDDNIRSASLPGAWTDLKSY